MEGSQLQVHQRRYECQFERGQIADFAVTIILGMTAIALIAISIIFDFGESYNFLTTFFAGFLFQATLLTFPLRRLEGEVTLCGMGINFEKDKLVKYIAVFYIFLWQVYVNLREPIQPWQTRAVYGTINVVYGMMVAAKIDNIRNQSIQDLHIPSELQERVPLNSFVDISSSSRTYDKTISLYPIPKTGVKAENREDWYRIRVQGIKFLLASGAMTTLLIARSFFSGSVTIDSLSIGDIASTGSPLTLNPYDFPLFLSYIYFGQTIGALVHEGVHLQYKKAREEYPLEESEYGVPVVPSFLQKIIDLEKYERNIATLLAGLIIAFNTPGTTIASGFLMGILNQIDLVEFTQTHILELHRLQRPEDRRGFKRRIRDWICSTSPLQWAFAIGSMTTWVWWNLKTLGFVPYNLYPVCSFPIATLSAYFLARWIDSKEIHPNSPRLLNWLFFYLCFSLSFPSIYIAANQTIPINDTTLAQYPGYTTIMSTIAVSSLGWAFGLEAAHQASDRNTPYPEENNRLEMLLSWFAGVQLLGR
ncbi:MAG: hypothetical protein H7A41_02110 [Chlamydiales bacterium]|nr:hypothetical protein [Chlamydiales bacterium]